MSSQFSSQLQRGCWMYKPGSKSGSSFRFGGGKWNRRFVWVENNAVHYGPSERKSERNVPLSELKAVRVCTEREIADEKGPAALSRNGWRLSTHDKVIIFVTENGPDRDAWVGGLSLFLKKTHQSDGLDEDDELTYRQIQESSQAFTNDSRVNRSMSMYSTANFNSDDVEELLEEEEAMREAFEQKMRKDFGSLQTAFYEEIESVIVEEARTASARRARSASVSVQRIRSLSSLPREEPQPSADDEVAVAQAAEVARQEQEEASRVRAELFQRHVQQQAALFDHEAVQREGVLTEASCEISEVMEKHLADVADIRAAAQRQHEAAVASWRRDQEARRIAVLSSEADARQHVDFALQKEWMEILEAKDHHRALSLQKERKRLDGERRQMEALHEKQRKDVVGAESSSRRTSQREESAARVSINDDQSQALRALRAALAQQLENELERLEASKAAERQQCCLEESTARDANVAAEREAYEEWSVLQEEHRTSAMRAVEQRVRDEAQRRRQHDEAEQLDLLSDEHAERAEVAAEVMEHLEAMVQAMSLSRDAAVSAASARMAEAQEQLQKANDSARRSFMDSEASKRANVARLESEAWIKSLVPSAQASRRKAVSEAQERVKRTAQEQKKAREVVAAAESQSRNNQRQTESSERAALATQWDQKLLQVRKREEHRQSLATAARQHTENAEQEARDACANEQSFHWGYLVASLSVAKDAFRYIDAMMEQESSDMVALTIAFNCGSDEAEEAYTKRLAAIARLQDIEMDARGDVVSEYDALTQPLEQRHRQGQQDADVRAAERARKANQFVDGAVQSLHDVVSEEARMREKFLGAAAESLGDAELAAARRVSDAATIAQRSREVERSRVSRSEAEDRVDVEQTEEDHWSEITDACAQSRDDIQAVLQQRRDALASEAWHIAEEEQTDRTARVAEEHEARAVVHQSWATTMPTSVVTYAQSEPHQITVPATAIDTSPSSPAQGSPAKSNDDGCLTENTSVATGASANASPLPESPVSEARSITRTSEERRRQRAQTITKRQEDMVQAAEAQWKAEQATLEQFVSRGTWMFKPGSQSSRGGSMFRLGGSKWNKRYVWVRNNAVYYGERQDKPEKPLSFRSLRKAAVVSALDAEREGCPKELRSFVWRLSSIEKTIFFACTSEKDRNNWVRFLEVVTGQTDMASTVTSMRSFAQSVAYEQSGWDFDDHEEFEETEEAQEYPDPFAEDDDDTTLPPQAPSEPEQRTATVQDGRASSVAFVPAGAAVEHQDLADASMPQTFEEWCDILMQEETDDRAALAAAEQRYRQKIVDASAQALGDLKAAAPVSTAESSNASVTAKPGRERSSTMVKRDEAAKRRAEAVAAAAAAEAEERRKIVTQGAWMFKPRSKSTTSSSLMRSISSIGGTTWNKRYVWVDTKKGRILYGEKPNKPEKEVPLRSIQSVYAVPPDIMKSEGAPRNLWTLGFKITADDRSIYWAATDSNVRRAFIEFLAPVAKRQPSGLQARPAAYASINNDMDEEGEFKDPFADDDDYDYDEENDDHTSDGHTLRDDVSTLPEVSGGPVVRAKERRKKSASSNVQTRELAIPLMALPMFLNQIDDFAHQRKDEGLVGVGVGNFDGLCIRFSGEVDPAFIGRMSKLVSVSQSLRDPVKPNRRSSSVTGDSSGDNSGQRKHSGAPQQPSSSTFSFSGTTQRMVPRSIHIEVEGPGYQLRTISVAAPTPLQELLFVSLHTGSSR